MLAEFARDRPGLYFYATRLPEADLLADFSRQAAAVVEDPYLEEAPSRTGRSPSRNSRGVWTGGAGC
ncbi:MAG: hypothetical protein AB1758_06890 [Candidatus Eremiobacterota bacterium]